MKIVVKRRGHNQEFDPKKLYASIYSACITLRMREGQAELIADNVTKDVTDDLSHHHQVDSKELVQIVVRYLEQYNSDAAYMYKTHRDIS